MRGWLAATLLLLLPLLAGQASAASERLVFDIPASAPGPIYAGRSYDLIVLNASGEGARGPGAVYDLVAQGSTSPFASAGAVADADRPGRVRIELFGVTFPEGGSYEVVGPDGFRLSFGVSTAPPGSLESSGALRLVVDGTAGRIVEPGRVPAGTRVDLAIVKLPAGDGSIRAGAVFSLRAPGEDTPRDRRAAIEEPGDGGLAVTFLDVMLGPGAWRVDGPSGFLYVLRVNAPDAGEDPTDAPLIRHPVGFAPPPAPRGTVADLTIVLIGITGSREVISTFDLVAPSGRVVASSSAYVIDPPEGEHLAVTFAKVALDEGGRWVVRGPESFAYSFHIADEGGSSAQIPAPVAPASVAVAGVVALALARRRE